MRLASWSEDRERNSTRAMASLLVLAALFLPGLASAESTFDDAVGLVRLPTDALRTWGFESNESVAGLELASWDLVVGKVFHGDKTVATLTPDVLAARLTTDPGDAVEGAHAIRLGDAYAGLAISDPDLWQSVAASRFEIIMWIRADGTEPSLAVFYDQDPDIILHTGMAVAPVRAIRTGRETSDGWVEISTGPIDGSVRGMPVRGVTIMPEIQEAPTHRFLVDALEVRKAEGTPTPDIACRQSNVDSVCGATGECLYGRCIADTVVWGPLPSATHRHELVERWVHWATHVMGDRQAIDIAFASFTPAARALADEATSARRFFGGMTRLVNELRDNHTSYGTPLAATNFSPYVYETSSPLGACFGVVDEDLLGGARGYAVFRASPKPITGVPLQVGDVVSAIDGEDPDHWLDENWLRSAATVPNDPAAEPSNRALDLSGLLALRASSVTLLRCASSTVCDAEHRQTVTVDIASTLAPASLTSTGLVARDEFPCTTRFQDAIPGIAAATSDTVNSVVSPTGTTLIQFDGFDADESWDTAMKSAFAAAPPTVLIDARIGLGGYLVHVKTLLDQVRGTSDPLGVISLERLSYDRSDPTPAYATCVAGGDDSSSCVGATGDSYFESVASPPGRNSKIAWLQAFDVSANDYASRLLKSRPGLQLFGPHPTSGAFGAREDLPPLVSAWYGGSLQFQDSHFATTPGGIASARWESGHGVAPDVVVAQKLSDAIAGVDTILTTAKTWLESAN